MANNGDWLPSREQDLVDLAQKRRAGPADFAKIWPAGRKPRGMPRAFMEDWIIETYIH